MFPLVWGAGEKLRKRNAMNKNIFAILVDQAWTKEKMK